MNEEIALISVAFLTLLTGLGFLGRYLYLDYKRKNDKSFIVIGLGLLAFWFFGGNLMIVIAGLLFTLVFFKGC